MRTTADGSGTTELSMNQPGLPVWPIVKSNWLSPDTAPAREVTRSRRLTGNRNRVLRGIHVDVQRRPLPLASEIGDSCVRCATRLVIYDGANMGCGVRCLGINPLNRRVDPTPICLDVGR